jgi:hypothetical protein
MSLDDVGKQPLAFAVWGVGIRPELVEIRCHCDQPLVDGFIEDELIVLSGALALFAGIGQDAELLVPFAFERVGEEAIVGIEEHETALGEIGFGLGALDRATAQPIRLFMPCFDLFADFERQFDGGRRHLLGNQHADGFVDRRPGDRLVHGLARLPAGRAGQRSEPGNACRIARRETADRRCNGLVGMAPASRCAPPALSCRTSIGITIRKHQ